MTPYALEDFLHQKIPLTESMDLAVAALGPWHIALTAPLAPNRNDKGTGFAGSLGAVLTLASWALLHARLHDGEIDCQLMIHKSQQEYLLPVEDDIMVHCELNESRWQAFVERLENKGKARISMVSVISAGDKINARMIGSFVALRK